MAHARPVLLVVDDDDLDVMIVSRALNQIGIVNPVVRKKDGEEALEYLKACSGEMPCVILLDLNMPRMDGFEFLCHVKAHPTLKDIPVVILTTSTSEADMIRSFKLGALEYVVKTMDSIVFRQSLGCVSHYCSDSSYAAPTESAADGADQTKSAVSSGIQASLPSDNTM